jgi:hypothetical protein
MLITNSGASLQNPDRLLQADKKLFQFAEHFDPVLVDWQYSLPSVIRDRIKMGTFKGGNGDQQTMNIFRGSLGPQSGLTGWEDVRPSSRTPEPGYDAGDWHPKTYSWGFEATTFTGLKTSWKSPNFSCYDWYTADLAREQLGLILASGAESVSADKETFCRETYMKLAADNGKFIVMADGVGLNYLTGSAYKVSYNPRTNTQVSFAAALLPSISTLSWAPIDLLRQHYQIACPGAGIKQESGMPVFAALTDLNEFESMVRNDPELREDVRYWQPQKLIEGFDMGFKTFRGIAISHDVSQARYRFDRIASDVAYLRRIEPMIATKDGSIGKIPEANPEYQIAEYGSFVIFLNDAFNLLVPDVLTNLAGMTFGPAPNYNGAWQWLNIQSAENMFREHGFFVCRMIYYVKMLRYAQFAAMFLYRRTPQTLKAGGKAESGAADSSTTTAAPAETAYDDTLRTVKVTLAKRIAAQLGALVTVATPSGACSCYIAEDAEAPTYKLAWAAANTTNKPVFATNAIIASAAVTVV